MSNALELLNGESNLRAKDLFDKRLEAEGLGELRRGALTTLQVNIGKLCNQTCHHCHVEAGPKRTENMSRRTVDRIIALLDSAPGVELVDVTGGAPEMNPNFRYLVTEVRKRGIRFMDRCNLTVLFIPGQEDTAEFLADQGVEIVASLPCYSEANVTKQRGRGVFDKSIDALQLLNSLGYGQDGSGLTLSLVYNPVGPKLPPAQAGLLVDYQRELKENFDIVFNDLFTITNMPIKRFAEMLEREGRYDEYMGLLVNHFNSATVPELMCRSLVSISHDGKLYDCDFNQMLELPIGAEAEAGYGTIWDINELSDLANKRIATDHHCFGCTAGAGSSCGGSLQ